MSDFESVKKIVQEIDVLKDVLDELTMSNASDVIRNLVPNSINAIELEPNTVVLLEQAADRLIDESINLLKYEIGERMKKLNIVSI
jgi:hypothetical protein